MDTNTIITYLACIIFLFIFGRIFILPIKTILKLVGNSILGGILILGINWVGQLLNFHIGINLVTSIFVGILGIPGTILLIVLKLLVGWKTKKLI